MTPESDSDSPLKMPMQADPRWREKIQLAREARALGKELREDKDATFRKAVGTAQQLVVWLPQP
jgi:hypothetical protein